MPDNERNRAVTDAFNVEIDHLTALRVLLDREYEERGVPIGHAVARVNKATQTLINARDYWIYDAIDDNAKLTKLEKQKQEAYDLL